MLMFLVWVIFENKINWKHSVAYGMSATAAVRILHYQEHVLILCVVLSIVYLRALFKKHGFTNWTRPAGPTGWTGNWMVVWTEKCQKSSKNWKKPRIGGKSGFALDPIFKTMSKRRGKKTFLFQNFREGLNR